ncbi:MAG: ParB/RepB/Spo0J family partition protein [Candidatus Cloacimonetes bacterium]|nr:ParB/RepB/Spo0J family partition protein [Candidatus Cloacimonadota bacterium]
MNDRLGRGLEALIRDIDEKEQPKTGITTLPANRILPNSYQPRKHFDHDKLQELAASIRENGIIQPIIVTKTAESDYELVAGERRLEAAKLAGLTDVPVIVRSVSHKEQLQLALIENIQREDLDPIEEANAYLKLMNEFQMTHAQISDIIGKDRSTITNSLRLLKLSDGIQEMIAYGKITSGHARAILSIEPEYQFAFAEYIIAKSLSVRQSEEKAKDFPEPKQPVAAKIPKNLQLVNLEKKLSEHLSCKTKIIDKNNKGKVVIEYKNKAELDTLISKLSHK